MKRIKPKFIGVTKENFEYINRIKGERTVDEVIEEMMEFYKLNKK